MKESAQRRRPILAWLWLVGALAAGGRAVAQVVVTPSQSPNSVKIFPLDANGDVAPTRDIRGDATGLGVTFATVVDTVRNEIYVADFGGDAVRVFPLEADGDVAPIRVIVGPATQLNNPIGMALSQATQELFVKPFGSSTVLVFPLLSSGDVAPSRVLTSSVPLDSNSRAVAVDPIHGEIFVTNQEESGSVLVFPIGASGVTAPTRILAGAATQLVVPGVMKLDLPHNELLVVANGAILTFGRTQSGNVPPTRSFTYSDLLGTPAGIDLDPLHDELVIGGQSSSGHILTFPRTATGMAVPLRDIAGPETGLVFNTMLAVYRRPLFADGFEIGTTAAWSSTLP